MRAPDKLDFMTICRALPQIAMQFQTVVPETFWTREPDGAVVDCPCGETTHVTTLLPTACGCERWFLYDSHKLRVARFA